MINGLLYSNKVFGPKIVHYTVLVVLHFMEHTVLQVWYWYYDWEMFCPYQLSNLATLDINWRANFSKSPTYSCSCVYGDSIQNTKAKKRTKERNAVHFLFSFFRSFFPSLFHSRAEVDCTALHTLLTTGMYESNCYYYWQRRKIWREGRGKME